MIYLKQFMIQNVQKCKNDTSETKTEDSEVTNLHILKCKNYSSGNEENTLQEVKKLHPNNTNINNTDISYTDSNLIISNDGMGYDVEKYTKIISENIELELLKESYPHEHELIEGIFDLILS